MGKHMLAFFEALDNVTDYEINTVDDDIVSRATTERFTLPSDYRFIYEAGVFGANTTRARLSLPSLDVKRDRRWILPLGAGVLPNMDFARFARYKPSIECVPAENLSIRVDYPDVVAVENVYGIVQIGSESIEPAPAGDRLLIRCTASETLTASRWTTVDVTPEISLPAGRYALIDFKPYSANLVAARAVIVGQAWRPGKFPLSGATEGAGLEHSAIYDLVFEKYNMGIFDHTQFPEFQFLANAGDTSEVVYVELVKIG